MLSREVLSATPLDLIMPAGIAALIRARPRLPSRPFECLIGTETVGNMQNELVSSTTDGPASRDFGNAVVPGLARAGRWALRDGPLIDALRADGILVEAPILPGHEPVGSIMPASSWRDWATASETAFDALAAAGRPVVVIGFSTGGTLALRLATHRPVARMVLLARSWRSVTAG